MPVMDLQVCYSICNLRLHEHKLYGLQWDVWISQHSIESDPLGGIKISLFAYSVTEFLFSLLGLQVKVENKPWKVEVNHLKLMWTLISLCSKWTFRLCMQLPNI